MKKRGISHIKRLTGAVSLLLAASVSAFALWSCTDERTMRDKVLYAMDTVITFRLSGTSADTDRAMEKCSRMIERTENILSRTVEGSSCSEFNGHISEMYYPDETFLEVLSTALNVAKATDGAYDPTVAALTDLWGINDPEVTAVPSDEKIGEALEHVGYEKIGISDLSVTKSDMELRVDLGGIGKGYACSQIIEYLKTTALDYGIVSFGGNVGTFGIKSDGLEFRVGIRDPFEGDLNAAVVTVGEAYVSVSGSYERFKEIGGEKYHHIFDPETGRPAESGLVSAAVVTADGALSDALSTALFVMGPEKAMKFYKSGTYEFEAVLITESMEMYITDGLDDSNFTYDSSKYTLKRNAD